MARKPLADNETVCSNLMKFGGCGALNIDQTRVPIVGDRRTPCASDGTVHRTDDIYSSGLAKSGVFSTDQLRYPANLIFYESQSGLCSESRYFKQIK